MFVTLIKPLPFSITIGIEVNPFSTIFVTNANDELIWFTSFVVAPKDDVYCVVFVTLIFASVFVVNVGEFNFIFWAIDLANAFA